MWRATRGMSLGCSTEDVLHVTDDVADPHLRESCRADLRNPAARTKARDVARNVLSDVAPRLEATTWWTPSWLDDVLQAIPVAFAQATDRWRTLYRSARTQYEQQGVPAVSPNADAQPKRHARPPRQNGSKRGREQGGHDG